MADGRRGAVALTLVAALATGATWAIGWWSLPSDVRADGTPPAALALLAPLATGGVLLAAAWLLARGRGLGGAVVLWTVVVLIAPGLLLLPVQLVDARGPLAIGIGVLGTVGHLAVVAAALLVRRHLSWAELDRGRTHVGVVVAGAVVVLGVVLPTVVHQPAGWPAPAGRAMWRPEVLSTHGLVDVVVFLLAPLALLTVLVVAARIHRPYASVVILAAIVPSVAGDLGSVGMALEQAHLRPTPVAWLSLAAQLALLAMAARWVTAGGAGPHAEPLPRSQPQPG